MLIINIPSNITFFLVSSPQVKFLKGNWVAFLEQLSYQMFGPLTGLPE